MRKLIIFYFAFILIPIANAVCVTPKEDMELKEDVVFCIGKYNLENGLKAVNDNIIIDCDKSELIGNGLNYGILLNGRKDIVVQNCNISNYEIGIYLDNTNNSGIHDNYLTKNKFGIALFNSYNNNVDNNIFFENINSNQVIYLTSQISSQRALAEEQKKETTTPKEIIQELISIKKPFLEQDEIFAEVNSIFDKYFDITQENLGITRTIFYDETDKSTKIILHLKPKKALLNLSIYEKIPKCVSEYANQILFETAGYEVVSDDPLILWYFAKLDKEKEVSYKVLKGVNEECKKLLLAFGIATSFEEFEVKVKEKGKANYLLVLSIGILIIVTIYFVLVKRQK